MGSQVNFLSGLIWLCVTQCCHSELTRDCDNGKADLRTDLPGADVLMCQEVWPQSRMHFPDIDAQYPAEAADSVCMDTPITYTDLIPTHGLYRPVEAESGEYLYCPPQRWLHNLKNGALVLLYHPCVSSEAHKSLAVLAHSCLHHYIVTPHPWLSQRRPLAVVSWGRSLEMSHITPGICDWLLSISYNFSQATTRQRAKYSLYLTKPAPVDGPINMNQEMSKGEGLQSLKYCCLEALHLNEELRTRSRKSRVALKQTSQEVEQKNEVNPNKPNSTESAKMNITETVSKNDTKEMTSSLLMTVPVTQSHSSSENIEEPNRGAKEHVGEMTDADKQVSQDTVAETHKNQINRTSHKKTTADWRRHRIKTDTKAQRSGSDCEDLGQCGVPESPQVGGPLRGERIPAPRTDEAVWAAAALGFLLVLLTLSVLHTRLYRHCRSSTSLYWRDTQEDFEKVGDIIRRRLRMVGRRKRRSNFNRRQECALLSSTEENSD